MYSNRLLIVMLFLTLAFNVFSETEDILIVGRSSPDQLQLWAAHLESLGDVKVTVVSTTPSDLSAYDEVWYADYQNWGSNGQGYGNFEEPSDNAISNILSDYLKTGGNIAFLTDHSNQGGNAAALQTHGQIEEFLQNTTIGNFQINENNIWAPYSPYTLTLVLDDPRLNLDPDLITKLESNTYDAMWSAATLPVDTGSGIGVLKVAGPPQEAFIGVAFIGESFKPEYQKGGRVFVFMDIFNSLNVSGNYDLLELIAGFTTGKDLTRPKLDVDTSGVVVPTGDVYYSYNSGTDFFANITTDDSCYIKYSINGTVIGNGIHKSTQVNFKDLPDSVFLEVTVTGTDIIETTKSWTFKRIKPATITLDTLILGAGLPESPDTNIFTIPDPNVYIASNGDTIKYSINGGAEIIYNSFFSFSTISEDTITIKVTASGNNVLPNTKSWIFIREKPFAKLEADPGDTVYDKSTINVTLTTDSGNTIIYQLLDLDSNLISGPHTIFTSGTVLVTGDMIISAIATGEGYKDKDSSWTYDSDLPQLVLKADPGTGTSFTMDTLIYITAEYNSQIVDADIYYVVDYNGTGTYPDSLTGTLYDPAVGITINNSATIYAIGYNIDYVQGIGSWTYEIDLQSITITATPSDDPWYGIGNTLDSIVLGSNPSESITLTWIMGTSPITDSAAFSTNGTVWDSVTHPSIKSTDSDTIYLSVMGTGHGYETTFAVFKYVRQYLPIVDADPSDPLGYKFSGTLDVKLFIDTTLGDFKNIKIYYLLDTTEAGNVASINDTEISNYDDVTINQTIYIKAIATADNAVTSPFVSYFYILSAGASSAWYKDETAGGVSDTVDGLIDAVTIDLSMPVVVLPDSAQFVSPFDTTDKITVSKSSMEFADSDNDRILVTLPKSFKYGSVDVNTKIDPAVTPNLGTLFGRYYVETPFDIADSVRPLINHAIYYPGAYELIDDSIIIHSDSILIFFSEEVTVPGISNEVNPGSFYSISKGITYDMDLEFDKFIGDTAIKFLVNRVSNSIIPSKGDSLRIIDIAGVYDSYGNVQNIGANRYGDIRDLDEREYPYTLKALSPVVPSKTPVPEEIKEHSAYLSDFENGVLIVADYYTALNTSNMTDVQAAIFDQVGNKVASINGYGKEKNIGVDVLTIDEPRSKTMVVLVWDGTNNKGRLVASGMYKALFNFTDPSGNKISREIAIGIKQEK